MIFSWLRRQRRKRILAESFPQTWHDIIASNVRHVARLPLQRQKHLQDFVQVFVAEKNWEGCNGFSVTEEVKVTIAAQASLLVPDDSKHFFDNVLSVLIYPDTYISKDRDTNADGVVTESETAMLGQAVWRGPVVLSWDDVLAGGRGQTRGENLVLHEFVHQLDMMNGRFVDGIPPLESKVQLDRWLAVVKPEFQAHQRNCRRRTPTVFNCYGAQNEAEFFSVTVECFFENPVPMQLHHPQIYGLYSDYFQICPVSVFHDHYTT